MPIWLIVTLVVISGLVFVPAFELRSFADKKVNWQDHDPHSDGVSWEQEKALVQSARKWMVVKVITDVFLLPGIFVWCWTTFMAVMAPYILGVSYNNMEEDYPQLSWMFKPLLPFIGLPMIIIALIIRCFYAPKVQLDTDVQVS